MPVAVVAATSLFYRVNFLTSRFITTRHQCSVRPSVLRRRYRRSGGTIFFSVLLNRFCKWGTPLRADSQSSKLCLYLSRRLFFGLRLHSVVLLIHGALRDR